MGQTLIGDWGFSAGQIGGHRGPQMATSWGLPTLIQGRMQTRTMVALNNLATILG